MESFVDTNNENNSSMLNNSEKIYLNKSFNKYLPEKPEENRNQRAKIDNKTHNSTKDTKNNAQSHYLNKGKIILYKESPSFDEEEPVICGKKKRKPTRHQQFRNVMLDT